MYEKAMLKASFSLFFTTLAIYFDVLSLPLIILIILMICDYITGMASAYISHTISSKTGIKGIIKKLCYFFAVIAAMGTDYIISSVNIQFETRCTLSLLVTIWLIINEIISILENLKKVGIPVPKFLDNIVSRLKISSDNSIKKQ